MKKSVAALTLWLLVGNAPVVADESWGSFSGSVEVKWLPDGRRMELLKSFQYTDPASAVWDAPQGWIVDGASIPRLAWSIIGGPFEGKYREASVIHDVACDKKERMWQQVHKTFYTAMLASDVDPIKAKIMYAAVYYFGPRWTLSVSLPRIAMDELGSRTYQLKQEAGSENDVLIADQGTLIRTQKGIFGLGGTKEEVLGAVVEIRPHSSTLRESEFPALQTFIENDNPSIEQIEAYSPSVAK